MLLFVASVIMLIHTVEIGVLDFTSELMLPQSLAGDEMR